MERGRRDGEVWRIWGQEGAVGGWGRGMGKIEGGREIFNKKNYKICSEFCKFAKIAMLRNVSCRVCESGATKLQ